MTKYFNFLIIALIFVLSTSSFALTPIPINQFKCGRGLQLYTVRSEINLTKIGSGIRCVMFGQRIINSLAIAWYGEGYEKNCSYRTLGQANYQRTDPVNADIVDYTSAQSDIWGNGECRQSNYKKASINNIGLNVLSTQNNFHIIIYYPNNVKEIWTKSTGINYKPLPRMNTCGNTIGLYQFKAVDGPGITTKTGNGIRCVLKELNPNTTWYGNGYWGSTANIYSELGTKHPTKGYGTAQIYGSVLGSSEFVRTYGSFNMNWLGSSAIATYPKDELWIH
jgi:hypothetical protein